MFGRGCRPRESLRSGPQTCVPLENLESSLAAAHPQCTVALQSVPPTAVGPQAALLLSVASPPQAAPVPPAAVAVHPAAPGALPAAPGPPAAPVPPAAGIPPAADVPPAAGVPPAADVPPAAPGKFPPSPDEPPAAAECPAAEDDHPAAAVVDAKIVDGPAAVVESLWAFWGPQMQFEIQAAPSHMNAVLPLGVGVARLASVVNRPCVAAHAVVVWSVRIGSQRPLVVDIRPFLRVSWD